MTVENDLLLALDRLKRSSPENFSAVEKAVAAYAASKLRECLLQADITQLPGARGQAQMADWFAQTFSNVTDKAQKLNTKLKP